MQKHLFFIFFLLFSAQAHAVDRLEDDIHSVELISAYQSTGNLSAIPLGLHYKFVSDWKTYWRYPGTAGYPVRIDTTGSQNVKSVAVNWPAPEEFVVLDLKSYGYGKEVVLPLTVVLEDPTKDTIVKLNLDYLVCAPGDCVPRQVELTTTLKAKDKAGEVNAVKSPAFELIESYINKIPKPDTGAGLTIDRVEIDTSQTGYHVLVIYARNPNGVVKPTLFIDSHTDYYIDFPEYEFNIYEQDLKIIAKVYENELKQAAPSESLLDKSINLVLTDGDQAIEANRIVGIFSFGWKTALFILTVAFIGGFILNFMPCVLPVIFIKVFSILEQRKSKSKPGKIRSNFMLTVAGIMSTFLIIALFTILFRNLGYAVGWGTQFQEPVFLIAIMLVILLFAYNLLGFFEITLSSRVGTKLAKIEAIESPFAHFLSGAFVTILATPCTAPFLGTALSFALSRGSAEILSLFLIMGLGLSLPFIMLAIFPGAVKFLPKPGKWMLSFKRFLSVLLFITIIWLMWTLSILHGTEIVVILTLVFAIVGFILYLKHKATLKDSIAWLFVLVLSVGSITMPYLLPGEVTFKDLSGTVWAKFDEKAIDSYVKQGKTVFVDVTADWCLTCKANELFVIDSAEVQEVFLQDEIVPMQADWTHSDPKITAFLKRFGKYAVPCYVVFGPKAPDGLVLPEILTTAIIKDALKQASGK